MADDIELKVQFFTFCLCLLTFLTDSQMSEVVRDPFASLPKQRDREQPRTSENQATDLPKVKKYTMNKFWRFFTALFTNMRTLKFKSRLHNCVFTAVNHNYDHKQRTLKHRNTKRIEIHQSQITNLDLLNPLK